jgi:hypothetical protein
MKKLICIAIVSCFAAAALGCPPEGAKKDDHGHKPGDGHDHSKDEKKK